MKTAKALASVMQGCSEKICRITAIALPSEDTWHRFSGHTDDSKGKAVSPCCILLWSRIPVESEKKDSDQFGSDSDGKLHTVKIIAFGVEKPAIAQPIFEKFVLMLE